MATTFDLLMGSMKANGELSPTMPESVADLMREEQPEAPAKPYLALQKVGRRANGHEWDRGSVVHSVTPGAWNALCGTQPQGSSDWSITEQEAVTCDKCLRKMAALNL
jgi:hypothetical protein